MQNVGFLPFFDIINYPIQICIADYLSTIYLLNEKIYTRVIGQIYLYSLISTILQDIFHFRARCPTAMLPNECLIFFDRTIYNINNIIICNMHICVGVVVTKIAMIKK